MIKNLLNFPQLYNLWQIPFYAQKMKAFTKENYNSFPNSILIELGCGPGTNIDLLKEFNSYFGIDNEVAYVKYAKLKYPELNFICADVCSYNYKEFETLESKPIHFLLNSLLHHLSDDQVRQLLKNIKQVCSKSMYIHVIDMIVPEMNSIPKYLALNDRGKFARTENHLRKLLQENLNIEKDFRFDLKFMGATCWKMVYFKTTFKSLS